MRHLHQPVNACIGAAGTHHPEGVHGKFGQGAFELVLNGVARELALPALVSAAVVADAQRDSQDFFRGGALAGVSVPSSRSKSSLSNGGVGVWLEAADW